MTDILNEDDLKHKPAFSPAIDVGALQDARSEPEKKVIYGDLRDIAAVGMKAAEQARARLKEDAEREETSTQHTEWLEPSHRNRAGRGEVPDRLDTIKDVPWNGMPVMVGPYASGRINGKHEYALSDGGVHVEVKYGEHGWVAKGPDGESHLLTPDTRVDYGRKDFGGGNNVSRSHFSLSVEPTESRTDAPPALRVIDHSVLGTIITTQDYSPQPEDDPESVPRRAKQDNHAE